MNTGRKESKILSLVSKKNHGFVIALFQHSSLLLFLIVLVSRLYFLSTHITFSQDQARDLYIVDTNIQNNVFFISYGPKTSVGNFTVFPLYYQLMILANRIVDHELTMYVVITVIESFTPVIIYFLLKLFVSKKNAWISSFIYSFSYLVLTYSTTAWSPNLIPFFSSLILFAWMSYLIKSGSKNLFLGVICLGLVFHFHFQAVLLIPFSIIIFGVSLKRSLKNIKYWLIGLLLVGMTYIPYFCAEIKNNWVNTSAIITFYTQEHSMFYDRVSKLHYVFSFFPGFFERLLINQNTPYVLLGRAIFFVGVAMILLLAKDLKKFRWLVLYIFVLVVSLRVFKGDKLDYYLMVFFFFPIVCIASILEKIGKRSYLIALMLVFTLGFNFSRPKYNDLKVAYINSNALINSFDFSQTVHLIFHDPDKANVYLYLLNRMTKLSLDRHSPHIIDVCQTNDHCLQARGLQCVYKDTTSYSALLKYENNYYHSSSDLDILVLNTNFYVYHTDLLNKNIVFPESKRGVEDRTDLIHNEIN